MQIKHIAVTAAIVAALTIAGCAKKEEAPAADAAAPAATAPEAAPAAAAPAASEAASDMAASGAAS